MLIVTASGPTKSDIKSQISQIEDVADVIELRTDLYNFSDLSGITSYKPFIISSLKEDDHICSYHNYNCTPQNLWPILERMLKRPSPFYKIVTTAQSTLDSLRMLHFVREVNKSGIPFVGHCMGELGQVSRILGKIYGNPYTYACLDQPIAPGQLSCYGLLDTYYFRQMNPNTKVYGLIGDPVTFSQSHITHNRYFRENEIDAVYVKMKIKPEELHEFFELAQQLNFSGLSVTMPLKQMCGGNTIKFDNGMHVCNTDGEGAMAALEEKTSLKGKKVLILGAGGAAQAVARAAYHRGAKLSIVNRTLSKAQTLAAEVDAQVGQISDYDILINCTSVGMGTTEIPLATELLLPNRIVLDAVSYPEETQLLAQSRGKGCQCISGRNMFWQQALRQFSFWFT